MCILVDRKKMALQRRWRRRRVELKAMAPTINLMLVDDHAMFRQGLADALQETPARK